MYVEELKNKGDWATFLQTSPEGTFYHSLKWKEVIQKSFPCSALYLTIKDVNGTIVGICPGFILGSAPLKIFCSIPYSDYGGPVIASHCIERASVSLRSFLEEFCSNNDIAYAKFCFMNDKLAQPFKLPLTNVGGGKGTAEIDLRLTPSDFIWNKIFSKNRRYKIRRFERDGFIAQEARTKSDLRDFYTLYCRNMKYIGASPYPYAFMENMWSILYPENLRIWLVGNERRIGGILVVKDGQRTYWVYAGIDRKQDYKRYSVIPYLLWKEIKTAEEEGYRYISLGATPSDPNHPYYLQKMSFGSSLQKQEMVWYPFSSTGRILLQIGAITISSWKSVKSFLPTYFNRFLANKLSRF